MEVLAEGVELKEQAEFLRFNGCTQSQGFLHSKPLNEDARGVYGGAYGGVECLAGEGAVQTVPSPQLPTNHLCWLQRVQFQLREQSILE